MRKYRNVIILTGASGTLGNYLSKVLWKEDVLLILIYNSNKISIEYSNIKKIQCDFVNQNQIGELKQQIKFILNENTYKDLIFIHAAGIYRKNSLVQAVNREAWIEMLDIHFFSMLEIIGVLIPFWEKINSGSIIAISSNLVNHPNYETIPYISSKNLMEKFLLLFAREVGKYNVKCNCIESGAFVSKMADLDENKKKIMANTPLQRLTQKEDIVNVIEMMLNEKFSWVTGNIICVDGGNSIGY